MGNGTKACYDLGGQSKVHNWIPKLGLHYFNLNENNLYKVYCLLYGRAHGAPGAISK